MDAGNTLPDAADNPVQVLQGAELGGSGHADGTKVYGGRSKNGISEIYGKNVMFVRFVRTVRFESAIV